MSEKGHFYEAETKQISCQVAQRVLNGFLEEVADQTHPVHTALHRLRRNLQPCALWQLAAGRLYPSHSTWRAAGEPCLPRAGLWAGYLSPSHGSCLITQRMWVFPVPRVDGTRGMLESEKPRVPPQRDY